MADAVRSLNPLPGLVHRQQPAGGRRGLFDSRFRDSRTQATARVRDGAIEIGVSESPALNF